MRNRFLKNDEGQVLVWFALLVPIICLFVALACDMGVIYLNKAQLCNAVDSAVLTGVKNYNPGNDPGNAKAQDLATHMFWANFPQGAPGGIRLATLNFSWCPGPNVGCPQDNAVALILNATYQVETTFMKFLPGFALWTIGDTAESTRSTLILTLVLDRSGSMSGNNGGVALQNAVPNFVTNFLPGTDYLGMVSFADNADVDVAITQSYNPAIDNAVAALNFSGGTFGTGAGTTATYSTVNGPPMSLADYENNQAATHVPPGQPMTMVVVYFTDGLMNEVQDTLHCTNVGDKLYNFGGFDAGTNVFDFFDPTVNQYPNGDLSYYYSGPVTGGGCSNPQHNTNGFCNSNPPINGSSRCQGVTQFFSQQHQTNEVFDRAHITPESQWRALYTSNVMRNETPIPQWFFVIGLGHQISGDPATQTFLATIANDATGQYNNVVNQNQPTGYFLIVPDCPGATCTQELNFAFQQIAAKVLLRLSR